MTIRLLKFQEKDFDHYYQLVSNEKVMIYITERSIPIKEVKENYRKILDRNNKFQIFGSYQVFDVKNENFLCSGNITVNEEKPDEAEIGYMILQGEILIKNL